MSKGLILITGINGYIAAQTAAHVLSVGYSVRGTARRIESAKPLLEGPLREYALAGQFSVVEVKDITIDGAFDEAVKDVTAILHLASPVSLQFTDPDPIMHAAIKGTLTLLNSALKAGPQLKTVVLASSIAAVRVQVEPPYTLTEKDVNTWAEAVVQSQKKETPGPVIYGASKSASERIFWEFKRERNPSFSMTSVNPVFVIGPPLIAPKNVSEVPKTTGQIYTVFSRAPHPPANAISPYVVDVRDVAKLFLHPVANPAETDGERYIASSAACHPQAYADILRDAFPSAKDRIVEGERGSGYRKDYTLDESQVNVNGEKAGRAIGGYIGFEKSVVDTARSFEGLVSAHGNSHRSFTTS